MATPNNDESTSLQGVPDAQYRQLMSWDVPTSWIVPRRWGESNGFDGEIDSEIDRTHTDWQPLDPMQIGGATEFHSFMELPSHIRELIREKAINQETITGRQRVWWYNPFVTNHTLSRCLAPVSKEWQADIESHLFGTIRINPSNRKDVLMFKKLFKKDRRGYLHSLEIIVDDRPTGPWHKAHGILQISRAMEKVGRFFHHMNSWKAHQLADLAISFVSLELGFPEVKFAPKGLPSIQTSSLWLEGQLNLLTNSDLASDMPLRSILARFPERFRIDSRLAFPLDCVPLPATIAMIRTMPNLVSCSFELSCKNSSEEGMANLTYFVQQLPTLLAGLRELRIRLSDIDPDSASVPSSVYWLSATLRDYSQYLTILKVEGILMQQNFFDSFGLDRDFTFAARAWYWPNLEEIDLQFVTFGPSPGPFSEPKQLSLTPAELLIAVGRATFSMPKLLSLRISVTDVSEDTPFRSSFSIKKQISTGDCRVKLSGFSKVQENFILEGWIFYMRAEARLVSEISKYFDSDDEGSDDGACMWLSTTRIYRTCLEDERRKVSHTLGVAALWPNASFLEAQRVARIK